jgi:hypothetical protein
VGHLNELHAKYRDKGVVILAVTNEGRGLVDKFVKDTSSDHPIVIEEGDSMAEFGGGGFPSSYLIDPDGNIAWAGHPASLQEAQIEALLPRVRLAPALPKKLAAAQKQLEKGEYAAAKKTLDGQLAGSGLDEADRKAATDALQWIEDRGTSMLASAESAAASDPHAAAETLRRAAKSFDGLPAGEKADAALKALLADKEKKREIDAGDAWEKTKARGKTLKPEQAAAMFRAFAKQYEGTKAGTKAYDAAVKKEAEGRRK